MFIIHYAKKEYNPQIEENFNSKKIIKYVLRHFLDDFSGFIRFPILGIKAIKKANRSESGGSFFFSYVRFFRVANMRL